MGPVYRGREYRSWVKFNTVLKNIGGLFKPLTSFKIIQNHFGGFNMV
jgi:hypothetical protein